MGYIAINGQIYSTVEAEQLIYKLIDMSTALTNLNTESEQKAKMLAIEEEKYEDKNDDIFYLINTEEEFDVDASSIKFNDTKAKSKRKNVQDALDELYISAQAGKTGLVTAINTHGGTATPTDRWIDLNDKMVELGENKFNSSYQSAYEQSVAANKKGTATPNDVLVDKTFSNANERDLVGAMPNNGAIKVTLDPASTEQVYAIPKGYHDGKGTVTVTPSAILVKTTWTVGISHRHYRSSTCTTDVNVQGYNKLSKTMSDTANTASASIVGYKADGTSVTISSTIGSQSNLDISPYYKIRIQSKAANVNDQSSNIKYIGTYTFAV